MKTRYSLLTAIGGILVLLGGALAVGGLYLITLGGSFFYLPGGAAMAGVGYGLLKRRAFALPLAFGLLTVSGIWAFWEVGTDFWQLVPRLITFVVLALLATVFAPSLHKANGQPVLGKWFAGSLTLVLAVVLAAIFAGMFRPYPEVVAEGSSAQVLDAQAGQQHGNDWPAWGRNNRGDRYAQFDQINKGNVNKLQVAWTFRTGDLAVYGAEYQTTPLKIDDTVYLCTPLNKVFALDPVSGKQKWMFDPILKPGRGDSSAGWKRCRGVAYFAEPEPVLKQTASAQPAACRKRIVLTTIDARLFSIDATTGKACEDFGDHGSVDLLLNMGPKAPGNYFQTAAPTVAGEVIVVGGLVSDNYSRDMPSGVVRAYNVRTGAVVWAWDPANPKRGTPLTGDEIYPAESPNFWGTAAYDAELGLVYVPTGNQTPDFWPGENRHDYSDEYGSSIVAIDVKTGIDRWHFRTVNHDMFDYDVASQPILYDLPNKQGGTTPVVIQLTKRGQVFVLDRRDGTPVFPVEQRPVPQDGMKGAILSPTQPYSALSIGATPFKESDMWGVSIFDQLYCRVQFKQMRWEGEFTPLSSKRRTMMYPGFYGGINWGGGAVDTATGTLIVNDMRMAQWAKFIRREKAERLNIKSTAEGDYSLQLGTPWGVMHKMFLSPLGVPCFKPPFGSMTAIDLTTGKTKWQVPLGSIEDRSIRGLKSGLHIPLGMPTMGGPLVTGGGLTFFHGTLDNYIRALDNDTGQELWRGRLPVSGQGAPMSYIAADGKQYVVVVAGGATRTNSNKRRGDYVIAYTLP